MPHKKEDGPQPDAPPQDAANSEPAMRPNVADNNRLSYDELLHELRIHQNELKIQNEALRQSQLALQQSRAHYLELYDEAPVGYVTLNTEGVITEANLTAAKLLGMDRSQLVNRHFPALIDPAYVAVWEEHYRRAWQTPEAHGCELPFRHLHDTLFYLHLDCLRINNKADTSMRITMTDVTERKNNEKALQIAAAAFDIAEGIFVTDAHNIIQNINQAFTRITGYSAAEAIGQPPAFMRSTVHNNDDFYKAKNLVIRQQGYWQGEDWGQRKNGEVFPLWLTKTAVTDTEGRVSHYVGAFSDMGERKRAEEKLRIAAAAFETQAGIIVTDANKIILRVNQAFIRISGYDADYAIGKTPFFLRSGLHDADFYDALWAVVLQHGYWQGEIWNRHCNGKLYPVLQTIALVKDGQGNISHYVGSFTDISAQKKAEKVLLEARDQLQNQMTTATEALEKTKAETQEVNTALQVLLKHWEGDKTDAQIALSEEIETTLRPFLEKLKGISTGRRQTKHLLDILDTNLKQLADTYGREHNLLSVYQKLTPIETQVACMIRQGLPTKVIATTLNISAGTVGIHRKHIRKKLDLDGKVINLHSYLMSLAE